MQPLQQESDWSHGPWMIKPLWCTWWMSVGERRKDDNQSRPWLNYMCGLSLLTAGQRYVCIQLWLPFLSHQWQRRWVRWRRHVQLRGSLALISLLWGFMGTVAGRKFRSSIWGCVGVENLSVKECPRKTTPPESIGCCIKLSTSLEVGWGRGEKLTCDGL